MQFHFKRIAELEEAIHHCQLFPKFAFNKFFGSAVLTLYPSVNLLPLLILSFFIKSDLTLIYFFLCLNVFLSFIFSYYSCYYFKYKKSTSFLFSIIYSLSTPFVAYEYYNMDIGTLMVISCLPLVVFGFYKLLNNQNWAELSFGITLIVYSHVLGSILVLFLLVLLILINIKKLNRNIILSVIKALSLSLLLTSFIWLPAIILMFNNFGNIYPPQLDPLIGVSFMNLIRGTFLGHMSFDLGLFAIIGLIIPLVFYKCFYKKFTSVMKQMYWIAFVFIFMCSNLFPWSITNFGPFKIFRILQFVNRLYVIPEMLLIYIYSCCVTSNDLRKDFKYLLLVLSIILSIGLQLANQKIFIHINFPALTKTYVMNNTYSNNIGVHHMKLLTRNLHFSYYSNKSRQISKEPRYKLHSNSEISRLINSTSNIYSNDYYPINSLSKVNIINNHEGIVNKSRRLKVKNIGYNKFSFNGNKYINKLSLPLLYYKGEHLKLYLDGRYIKYDVNRNNMITIHSVKQGHHYLIIKDVSNVFLVYIKIILFLMGMIWIIKILYYKIAEDKLLK